MPTQNGFIESFDGHFRDEYLNERWSSDIAYARKIIKNLWQNYNECCPHSLLNYQTPYEIAAGRRNSKLEVNQTDITN